MAISLADVILFINLIFFILLIFLFVVVDFFGVSLDVFLPE